jgi:hypothetical protein
MVKKKLGFEIIINDKNQKIFKTNNVASIYDDAIINIVYNKREKSVQLYFQGKSRIKIFNTFLKKLEVIYKILTNKPVEFDTSFGFRNREHILNFVDTLDLLASEVDKENR